MRGLPATPDVGIIANLLLQLRDTADDKLRQGSSKKASQQFPSSQVFLEDLSDAMGHAGLSPSSP